MEGEFKSLEDRLMIAQARVGMLERDPSLQDVAARQWRIVPSKEIVTVQLVTGDSSGQEVSDPLFAYFSKQGVFLAFDDLGQRGVALAKQARQIKALDDAVLKLRGQYPRTGLLNLSKNSVITHPD